MNRGALLFLAALTACAPGDAPPESVADPAHGPQGQSGAETAPAPDRAPVPVTVAEDGPVSLAPQLEAPPRARQRMDLDQLEAAVRQVSGGIMWTANQRGQQVSRLRLLASTLGKPDYFLTTAEDLSPSVVFVKFLDDMARDVCGRMVARDQRVRDGEAVEPPLESPIVIRHADPAKAPDDDPQATTENLRHLLRHFHGRLTDVDDPGLSNWQWLVRTAHHTTGDPVVAWQTVCVGLMMHHDFYTY